jgi:peptidoglycan LD-endopeptidase CwlK
MTYVLGTRSLKRLEGVHPDLVRVVQRAIKLTPIDFTVLEGRRTPERQRELFAQGATKTLNSRHLTGHAVDLAPFVGGEVRWDWPLYHKLAAVVKDAARQENVPIQWGGDWRTFKDGPHWELPWAQYPKENCP